MSAQSSIDDSCPVAMYLVNREQYATVARELASASRAGERDRGAWQVIAPLGWQARFWLAVMRFAYRRARLTDGWRMPVGIPGNRDPENPCEAFAPRPREPFEWGNCQTDGHYLCNECCHRAVPESGPEAL